MKIALAIIMCSYVYSECMKPYTFPEKYNNHYECMIAGYEKSLEKMKEIGSRTTNREELYFKFVCYPLKPEEKIPINFVPLALD